SPTTLPSHSLHDALPILRGVRIDLVVVGSCHHQAPICARLLTVAPGRSALALAWTKQMHASTAQDAARKITRPLLCFGAVSSSRSEEHTSELQSRENLV